MSTTTNRGKVLIFFLLLLSVFAIRTISLTLRSDLQDYSYYLKAAQNLLSGQDPYFTYPTQVYPPASLLLFIPLSLLPPDLSKLLWTTISLISLFLALNIFSGYALKKDSNVFATIFFLISLQTFPVKYALAQGQVNFLVFLGYACIFHFLSQKKLHLTGLILSLIVILKVNPLLLIPYLILTKNTKSLPVFLLGLLSLNLYIDLLFPHPLNKSFLQSLVNMSTNYSGYYYNTSLAGLFIRLTNQQIAGILNLAFSGLVWILVFISSLKAKHNPLTFSLFLVAILLTSPITWQHYLFWSLPAFLILVSRKQNKLTLILTALSFSLINLNLKDPQQLSMTNPLYSHATFGLLLLFLILILENQRVGSHSHQSVS